MRFLPALLLLYTLGNQVVYGQSPWVRSKAGAYAQVACQWIPRYNAIFDVQGKSKLQEWKLSEQAIQVYGEYGLSKRTTGIISIPVRSIFMDMNPAYPGDPLNDLDYIELKPGNVSLSLRHQLRSGNLPITFSMRVDLPTWVSKPAAGLRSGYPAFTILPMLSTGKGYEKTYWYGYAGYALRTNQYSDYALVGFEIGRKIGRFRIIGYSELLLSMKNRTRRESETYQRTALYVNNQAYWSLGLKGIIRVNRFWGFIVGGAGVIEARLLPQQPQIQVGTYFNWE
jgi:hypothetical protein